jgi:hypothetical protein
MKISLKRKRKEMETPNRFSGKIESNKFAGKRKYSIRQGLPEKTLIKLKDLHEMLQCDPDEHGYVVTTFKEIQELTEMDLVILSLMIHNGMIQKAYTGGSPKFKYKWDTIKPTIDMAVKLLENRIDHNQSNKPEGIISESQPESIIPETEEDLIVVEKPEDEIVDMNNIIMDSLVKGDIMTMHVNLKKLGIKESDVLNAVLSINTNK